jgi:MoaA/NifB/PqqE/SkfB family radical SAM enzyme
MSAADWRALIDEAAAMGVPEVQLIGGEPTLHPNFPELLRHALDCGVWVEVYSNLVHVTDHMWELFSLPGVRLASSYYSDDPDAHNAVTRRSSHRRTRANIEKAVALGIPLRVAVIEVDDGQGAAQAAETLRTLGVARIDYDRVRGIGRGVRPGKQGTDQLCGKCGYGRMAVLPSGEAVPCVLSRWMALGRVGDVDLGTLYKRAQVANEEIAVVVPRSLSKKCPPPCPPPKCPPPNTACPPPKDGPTPICTPPLRKK